MHLVIHPILQVKRDKAGNRSAEGTEFAESFMQIRINEQSSADRLKEIGSEISAVLSDVRAAVEDWQKMKAKAAEAIASLAKPPKGLPPEEVAEAREFLEWLDDDQFAFLGWREYSFSAQRSRGTPASPWWPRQWPRHPAPG